jgi:tetratricopeptide (TPR) repeat protein
MDASAQRSLSRTNEADVPPELPELTERYQQDLAALAAAPAAQLRARLVALLRRRDTIKQQLEAGADDAASLLEIASLDTSLKALAPQIERAIGVAGIRELKAAGEQDGAGWWWSLDQHLPGSSVVHKTVTAIAFTGSVSLVTEIARRFFAEGPDVAGVFYTLVQAALALTAGAALIGSSGGYLETRLDAWGIRRARHPILKSALAIAVLGIVLAALGALPLVASQYNEAGVARAGEGQVTRAIRHFRKALSLNPDFAQAHYNLGRVYEGILERNSALGEYQKAIQADPGLYLAYNSLARLYIVQGQDLASALDRVDRALELLASDEGTPSEQAADVRLALYKNRGWANFALGNTAQARADLQEALSIDAERASVHCLLAQVIEKEGGAADGEWSRCLGYSTGATDVERVWLAMAQDRLVRP